MNNLDIEIMERNRDLFLNTGSIFFCGLTELFISKSFFYYLENFDPNIPISFFTNGQLLSDKMIEKIINHNIISIGISIDAGTEETYRKIRGHGNFTLAETLSNVENLIRRFEQQKKQSEIKLLFTTMRLNYLELPEFLENGIDIGVKKFSTWHMRKRTGGNEYRDHVRNGCYFRYEEQSLLENKELYNDFVPVREKCFDIAARNNVVFETEYTMDNEYFV